MIDMIKKEEENTNKARLIKKTHKGEVDVDGDEDLSTLEVSILSQIQSVVPIFGIFHIPLLQLCVRFFR